MIVFPRVFSGLLIFDIVSIAALEVKQRVYSQHVQNPQVYPTAEHQLLEKSEGGHPFYEPDLTELVLLAGNSYHDISITRKTMKRIGWTPGVRIQDATLKENCFFDHAWTFRKGTHCVVAFSGNDDIVDEHQMESGTLNDTTINVKDLCGFAVHAGLAQEMFAYTQSPNWGKFVEYLNQRECEMVTSVGHSMGGAVASIFAACANRGEVGFGDRKDFGLVTFGAPPISPEPLYNGIPGVPFRGTRYHIAGYDSGLDARLTLPQKTQLFRLDIIKFYKQVAAVRKLTPTYILLSEAEAILTRIPEFLVEKFWAEKNIFQVLQPILPLINEVWAGSSEDRELSALQPFLREMMLNSTNRMDINYMFDPYSVLFAPYGYKHPLVDYQPISSKMILDVPLRRIPSFLAVDFPKHDPILATMGQMLTGTSPNHATCCYYRAENCLENFEVGFRSHMLMACPVNLFR